MKKFRNTVKKSKNIDFSTAVSVDKPSSTFRRDSSNTLDFNCGDLVPIYLDEVLPGDHFKMDLSHVARLSTPVFPTMANLDLDFWAFFCPNRLLWDNWEELIANTNNDSFWAPSTPPAPVPTLDSTGWGSNAVVGLGSVADYLGYPVGCNFKLHKSNVMPLRFYYRLWNEFFRDENLQAPISVGYGDTTSDGELPVSAFGGLLKVNKPHDYFTSCLPQPQKGDSPVIPISINQIFPVNATGEIHSVVPNDNHGFYGLHAVTRGENGEPVPVKAGNEGPVVAFSQNNGPGVAGASLGIDPETVSITKLKGDLTFDNLWANVDAQNISTSTINDLRTAFQIQRLLELDARGGTRLIENILAHFGVHAGDYRLQRCECLGEYHDTIGIYQVAQTSSTDESSPMGSTAAFGYSQAKSKSFIDKTFVEHGYIMIVCCARQKKVYCQGIEKLWSRSERFDFYFPVLSHISEQPVLNKEIYASPNPSAAGAEDNDPFGYQEAWAEYKMKPSRVCAHMRPNSVGSLANFNYADWYSSVPYLSDSWITDNSQENVDRTLAVPSNVSYYQVILDVYFNLECTRVMPLYCIPGYIDHF